MNTENVANRTGWWLSIALVAVVVILASLSSACEPGEIGGLAQLPTATEEAPAGLVVQPGPQTWIEYPLEGQTLPLGPLPFVVYATDTQGVAQVELLVNGNPVPAAQAEDASADGSRRLVYLEQEWTPDREGEHIAEARGRNAAGSYGEPASVRFCIGSCEKKGPTPTPTQPPPGPSKAQITFTADRYTLKRGECTTLLWSVQGGFGVDLDGQPVSRSGQKQVCPQQTTTYWLSVDEGDKLKRSELVISVEGAEQPPPPTETPTPSPPTETPPPSTTPTPPPADIRFWADSDNVPAGSCTTVHWHVVNVKSYWVDGQPGAGDEGGFETCPCQEEMHVLHVVKADGSEQDFSLTIHVSGECAAPPPAQDTEGPLIEDVGLRAQGTTDTGCRAYGYSRVSDPSGVGWARLHYSLDGEEWYSADMGDRGDGYYEAVIAGATGGDAIQFYVEASDTLGNTSRTETEYDYLPLCGPG
jgi:hypothetical protein